MLRIETPRLYLIPASEEVARAALTERSAVEQQLDAQVPTDWPTPDLCDLLPFYADQLAADPAWFGWGVWLIIHAASRTLIGDIGFKGPPDASGTVEIGYSVLPAFQRQGYATEAARGLVSWACAQSQISRVIAECLADNQPSMRVLERLGMRRLPSEGEMLKWELRREAAR